MKNKPKKHLEEIEYEETKGNIFAVLGFANPEQDLVKANLVAEISNIVKKKKITQAQLAKILGVNQPRISSLLSGNLDLFSIEMLMKFLQALGQDIEIVVKPKPNNRKLAHFSVVSSVSSSERTSIPIAASSR